MTYTREQILSMPAGKELDKIAANAIGYVSLTTHLNSDGTFGLIPRYSTDISAAWELIENPKIMDKYQLGLYPTSFGKWICRSFMPGYDITVQADTAPEAITKAAILAMMEQSGGTGEGEEQ